MNLEYRVIRLYRAATGWCYWLQRGCWVETNGPHGMATGCIKRRFRVDFEEPYKTHNDAVVRLFELSRSA